MIFQNRLCNSVKNFKTIKYKNNNNNKTSSNFYDICIQAISNNNDKIINKEECIKGIKKLKIKCLNKNIRNKKKYIKINPMLNTVILSHKTLDSILEESKNKTNMIMKNLKLDLYTKDVKLPNINNEKVEKKIRVHKYFQGKNKRFTVYKHITEYLESNNVTMAELIENNPFQTKPFLLPGSREFLQAVKFNNYEFVKSLLKKNVNYLFTIDYFGQTAYHWAAKFSDYKMMEILLSFGKHHNQKDFKGRTPIYLAAINNNKDMCDYLLKNGANPFLKDKESKSPADVASNWDLKYFLKEHMSHPFNNPVYKQKLKKIMDERTDNLIKKRLSGLNKFVVIAEQIFEVNKHFKESI